MKFSQLSVKITVPIALISALAIGLTAFLNLGKFERSLTELESSRLQFVLGDLKSNLETGLDLGLALNSLDNAQAVIDATRKQDASILSINIYDDAGAGVFETGPDTGSPEIPPSWKRAMQSQPGHSWYLAEAGMLIVGVPLASNIKQDAGHIVMRYSRSAHDATVASLTRELVLASLAAIAVTAGLVLLGINLLVAKTNRRLAHIAQTLERSLMDPAPVARSETEEDMLLSQVIHSSGSAMQDLSLVRKTLTESLAVQTAGPDSRPDSTPHTSAEQP
ncbi:hypothetical protein ACO0LO_22555 [Undibacterium sp. TJN25]|uniref:hypothetical protein n=1 Tax=Undibacterium sp. TJN25 TaxID=3413056 RepID=UPI003BEFCEF5